MFVNEFFTQTGQHFSFSRQQGSRFAKQVARDFNPLHNETNSRFCVPGDLLFALTLSQYGVSCEMSFDFQGMVGGDIAVEFIESDAQLSVIDAKQKNYMTVTRSGQVTKDSSFVEGLIRSYVAFSGETFPHILVELMQQEQVMINPDRPMVIYENMSLSFSEFSEQSPQVLLSNSRFDVDGKRGLVTLEFDIQADGKSIGKGKKQIIMSGLRPYQHQSMSELVTHYEGLRSEYFS